MSIIGSKKFWLMFIADSNWTFLFLFSKNLMKIRTLQLIGGAGRGACCLLRTVPPVLVSILSFCIVTLIFTDTFVIFCRFQGLPPRKWPWWTIISVLFCFCCSHFFLFCFVMNKIWKTTVKNTTAFVYYLFSYRPVPKTMHYLPLYFLIHNRHPQNIFFSLSNNCATRI